MNGQIPKTPPFLNDQKLQMEFFLTIFKEEFDITFPLWEISGSHWIEFNSDKIRIFINDSSTRWASVICACSYDKPLVFIAHVQSLLVAQVLES